MRVNDTRYKVYDYICDYVKTHGYSPSMREIAKGVGIGLSTVRYHLMTLKAEGMISLGNNISRSIVLT